MKPSRGKRKGLSGRLVAFSRTRSAGAGVRTFTGRRSCRARRDRRTSVRRGPRPVGRRREGCAPGDSGFGWRVIGARIVGPPPGRGEIERRVCPLRGAGRPASAGLSLVRDCSQCRAAVGWSCAGCASRDARGLRLMSATFPTRLETRTKESKTRASHGAVRNPTAQ